MASAESTKATIQPIKTDKACPVAGPYSQAILLTPAPSSRTLYISGQLPYTSSGSPLPEGSSIADKTSACLANISAILTAASPSATLQDIVKVNIFLADMSYFAEMNKEYERVMGGHRPARSCVAVRELPKGVEVEIEAVAAV